MKLTVKDKDQQTITAGICGGGMATLVHTAAYREGDVICLELEESGVFCEIQLDDAMLPAVVFIEGASLCYTVPFGEKRTALSPKAFGGDKHLVTARLLQHWEIPQKRNLALNPYDGFTSPGVYPHADANVETRNEAVFAARNAIDGIFANNSHGLFPYGSWGINRQADAGWKLDFGRKVRLDELRVTLRADFPHDNYWTGAEVAFSDGGTQELALCKTHEPQAFATGGRCVSWLVLKNLVQSGEPSPFPALTQLEAFGAYIIE